MKREILRFHYEEIVYILMILNTDLKTYSEEDLKIFAEGIHRLDILSKKDFLTKLEKINPYIDNNVVNAILELQRKISNIYSKEWHKILANGHETLDESRILSRALLKDLQEEYMEPLRYMENYMNVDW